MSQQVNGLVITQLAGADLSTHKNKLVKNSGADMTVALAVDDAAPIVGVINDFVQGTSGTAVGVMVNGVAKVVAGAAVTVGAKVTADASGRAVTVGTGVAQRFIAGIALEAAGGANELISVLLQQGINNTAVS